MSDTPETTDEALAFDFSAYPPGTLFFDRRSGRDRRHSAQGPAPGAPPGERRQRKERRRRVDPTTFEKQYTADELEFMNAMHRFKVQSGKTFPSHRDVLRVACSLGYRRAVSDPDAGDAEPTVEDGA